MKRKLAIFQIILALLLIVTKSTAYAGKMAAIKGTFQSDKVEVAANLLSETKEILPGERAKQLLTISNLGSDCFLRVTPRINTEKINVSELEFDCGSDWIFKNNSFYCTKALKKDKSISFCESVLIPSELSSGSISIEYSIDAIQSDNYTPEFTSLNPWGSVEIIEAKKRGQKIVLNSVGQNETGRDSLEIYYNEDAKSLITNFDEIFENIPLIMPGDSFTEEIKLKNKGKEAKTLYLSDITDDASILKYINISISASINGETKEVFSGVLGDVSSNKKLNVGSLLPGEEGSLIISANMSKDANNDASNLSTHLSIETWAEPVVGETDKIGEIVTEKTEKENLQIRSAKTGDDLSFWKWIIVGGFMLLAGVLLIGKRE